MTYRPHPNRALCAVLHSVTELNYVLGPCDETTKTGWCYHVDRVQGKLMAVVTETQHGPVPIEVYYFFETCTAEVRLYIAVYGHTTQGWVEQVSL